MNRMPLTYLMHLKSWHWALLSCDSVESSDFDHDLQLMHLLFLKSWPWAPIFNSLDPFDSDQGPTLMLLINLKVLALEGATFDSFGPLNSGQGPNLMTVMHLKSWPVADFKVIRFIKCIRFRGPGGAWWSLNLKSWGPLSMHWIQ